jgi:hypothetical protein
MHLLTALQSILFRIKVNVKQHRCPFASIQDESTFKDEKEVLFSMGSVFRIETINEEIAGCWLIDLTLTDEEDLQLQKLSKHIRSHSGVTSSFLSSFDSPTFL